VDSFTGDTIVNFVASRSLRTSFYDFNIGIAALEWPPVPTLLLIGFPLVTLVEVLAPLALFSRSFRVIFFATMVPFHVLTLLLMEVSFMENLLLYALLIDASRRWPNFARLDAAAGDVGPAAAAAPAATGP
jgi:hypothetical protein